MSAEQAEQKTKDKKFNYDGAPDLGDGLARKYNTDAWDFNLGVPKIIAVTLAVAHRVDFDGPTAALGKSTASKPTMTMDACAAITHNNNTVMFDYNTWWHLDTKHVIAFREKFLNSSNVSHKAILDLVNKGLGGSEEEMLSIFNNFVLNGQPGHPKLQINGTIILSDGAEFDNRISQLGKAFVLAWKFKDKVK